jgi:hypothetical protein
LPSPQLLEKRAEELKDTGYIEIMQISSFIELKRRFQGKKKNDPQVDSIPHLSRRRLDGLCQILGRVSRRSQLFWQLNERSGNDHFQYLESAFPCMSAVVSFKSVFFVLLYIEGTRDTSKLKCVVSKEISTNCDAAWMLILLISQSSTRFQLKARAETQDDVDFPDMEVMRVRMQDSGLEYSIQCIFGDVYASPFRSMVCGALDPEKKILHSEGVRF